MAEITRPTWEPSSRVADSWTLTLRRGYLVARVFSELQTHGPSPTPYAVIVFGTRLAKRYATAEEAKAVALAEARHVLAEATDNLTAFEDDK